MSEMKHIECPNCGMPFDVPEEVDHWSCDCGASWELDPRTDGGHVQDEAGLDREEILGENDPEAYEQAADRVTAPADRDVWVVESKYGEEWGVVAVFTSYADADDYIEDARDFAENCPESAPEDRARNTVSFRHGSRQSPTKLYESWPPENGGESS